MEKAYVKTWIFMSLLIAIPGMVEAQSPTGLSASVTTVAQTELTASDLKSIATQNKRRKKRVKSRRIEHSDAELSQILNETTEILAGSIQTKDVDLRSLLHATSGHTIKPMEKWL